MMREEDSETATNWVTKKRKDKFIGFKTKKRIFFICMEKLMYYLNGNFRSTRVVGECSESREVLQPPPSQCDTATCRQPFCTQPNRPPQPL